MCSIDLSKDVYDITYMYIYRHATAGMDQEGDLYN